MDFVEILYIVIAVAVVVITVTFVWLSNELIGLIKSVKRSSRDAEKVTREIREKVMLVSESLDRAGQAASSLVGLMEDAVEAMRPRRDRIAESLAVISGAGKHAGAQQKKESEVRVEKKPAEKVPDKKAEKSEKEEKSENEEAPVNPEKDDSKKSQEEKTGREIKVAKEGTEHKLPDPEEAKKK